MTHNPTTDEQPVDLREVREVIRENTQSLQRVTEELEKMIQPCPGCGDPTGPCPNCACVRP